MKCRRSALKYKKPKASLCLKELATTQDIHDGLVDGVHQNKFTEVGNDPGRRRAITVDLAAEQNAQRSEEDGRRDEHKRDDTQRQSSGGFPLQFDGSLTVSVMHHNIRMFSVGNLYGTFIDMSSIILTPFSKFTFRGMRSRHLTSFLGIKCFLVSKKVTT